MEKVCDEVVYPEELTLKKRDYVADTVSDKTGHQTFQLDYEEPIQVVQEFDPRLKFVTFTIHRDPENDIHPPPPLKSAFEVLMTRQNSCNKFKVRHRT